MTDTEKAEFFASASKTLKALGHPERLRIIEFLQEEEKSVGQIQRELDLPQPITSQHLRYMQRRNILASRREGTRFFYFLASDMIVKILNCVNSCKIGLEAGEFKLGELFPEKEGVAK
ncbi:MAG: metalloregulator ArsR/SmtB family transcription factor [Candidatus Marinimicrobia bacterium]|nr:metalloregulator ArsR/SmtB family transcription factor [Candidatus Neomarinimicrobiota bacterium]MCF7850296.1 metalloregulator ArsR/SmtB family transcription factor [Candidatus Neomarinimicrobiota bacterium]